MHLFVIFMTIFVGLASTYKVLVYSPTFGASHSNFLGKISDILIDDGNDVTMLIPVILKSKENLVGSTKVTKIVKIEQNPRNAEAEIAIQKVIEKKVWKMNSDVSEFFSMASTFSQGSGNQCEYVFQQTGVIEALRNESFELGIAETSFICGFALFDHIGVKTVINTDSTLMRDSMKYALGEPASTSFYPGVYSALPDEMDLFGRIRNFFGMAISIWFLSARHSKELEMIKPYYNGSKTSDELLSNVAYNFINSNQYLDYPSPVLPKTVFIGGMQVRTKKNGKVKLSQNWVNTLNERKTNVLISFGSNAHSSDMPDEFKSALLQVFESMPNTTFIWKYEIPNSTIADHLPNVVLSEWTPQNELLADDRLSLFITHGGLGSTMEIAYQGKPAVVIPLMTDQPRNAHMLTRHGGAIQLDKTKLNDPAEIKNAIETILNNKSYSKNAQKLSKILQSQPNQPTELVLKHCNFAVKFGPLKTLDSHGKRLATISYYNIDVFIIIIVSIFLVISSIFLAVRCIFHQIFKLIYCKRKIE